MDGEQGLECHVVMRAYGDLAKDEEGEVISDEATYNRTEVQGVFFTVEEADMAARRIFAEDVLQQEDIDDEDLEDATADYEGATDDSEGQVGLLLEKIDDNGETDLELDVPANKVWVERSAAHGEPPGFMRIDMGDVDGEDVDIEVDDQEGEEPEDYDDEEEPAADEDDDGEEEPAEAEEDEQEEEDEEEPEEEEEDDGEETQIAGAKRPRDDDEDDDDGDGDGDEDEEEG